MTKQNKPSMVASLLDSFLEACIINIPGSVGRRMRYIYYQRRLKHIGSNVYIDVGVRILNPKYVSIGNNTWIDNYVVIIAGPVEHGAFALRRIDNPSFRHAEGEVVIGSNCHIALFAVLQGHGGVHIGDDSTVASGCLLYSLSHHYRGFAQNQKNIAYKFSSMSPPDEQSLIIGPVVMERNTALGLNSVMLPGATIQEGSWVGVGSVIHDTIPAFHIASGNPAQVIKRRDK